MQLIEQRSQTTPSCPPPSRPQTQAPLRWRAGGGQPVSVDTPVTLWARQLRDIHTSLTLPGLTSAERADILSTLITLVRRGRETKMSPDMGCD